MIIIAGTLRIHPEARMQALEAFQKMKQASRAEDGCISYDYYVDAGDPSLLFIFERWVDEKALQAHGWSPHMAEFRRTRATFIAGDVNIKRYDVEHERDA